MNQLTKNLMCIVMRNGIETWVDGEKLEELMKLMERQKFIKIGQNILNVKDILGVFTSEGMQEYRRHKAGEWKCDRSAWHKRNEDCTCPKTNDKGEIFVMGQGWVKIAKPGEIVEIK